MVAGSGGFAKCGVCCWVCLREREREREREMRDERERGEERETSFFIIILLGNLYYFIMSYV